MPNMKRDNLLRDVENGFRNVPVDLKRVRDWLRRRRGEDLTLNAFYYEEGRDGDSVSPFIVDCAARGYIMVSFAFDREDLDFTLTPEGLEALRRFSAGTEKE